MPKFTGSDIRVDGSSQRKVNSNGFFVKSKRLTGNVDDRQQCTAHFPFITLNRFPNRLSNSPAFLESHLALARLRKSRIRIGNHAYCPDKFVTPLHIFNQDRFSLCDRKVIFYERIEPLQPAAGFGRGGSKCHPIGHGVFAYVLQLPGEVTGSCRTHTCCLHRCKADRLSHRGGHGIYRIVHKFIDLAHVESSAAANCLPDEYSVSRIKLAYAYFLLDNLRTIEAQPADLGAYQKTA